MKNKNTDAAPDIRKKRVKVIAVICSVLVLLAVTTIILIKLSSNNKNDVPATPSSQITSRTDSQDSTSQVGLSSDKASDTQDKTTVTEKEVPVVASPKGKVIEALLPDVMVQYDTLVILNGKAYEYYGHNDKSSHSYADAVNYVAKSLSGKAKVYAIVPPSSMGIQFPDKYRGYSHSTPQDKSISAIYSYLDDSVVKIDTFDTLMMHKDENIFFRTDHHWTSLGAYYAFEEFCKSKGITADPVSTYDSDTFEDFRGSFYKFSNEDEHLKEPEPLTVFYPKSKNAKLHITAKDGKIFEWPIINNVEKYASNLKYSTFIGADNSYSVITNPDVHNNKSCLVVKDSFGNALIPFLTDYYEKIHIVDYRFFKGSVSEFALDNKVDDVLFINNISIIRNPYTVSLLNAIK